MEIKNPEFDLDRDVIDGGYCVGCGACAGLDSKRYRMHFGEFGTYLPVLRSAAHDKVGAASVCPFGPVAPNEDDHGRRLYADASEFDQRVGRYREILVGSAETSGFRECGSSGGLTNWLLARLLECDEVDAVVGVAENRAPAGGLPMYTYQIARDINEIRTFAKSKYYPVELSGVIEEIRSVPGRYAIVGVPCFAKAIRNLCEQDKVLASRIRFVIAIVCGHLKSAGFAQSLAWQAGIPPHSLKMFDFRVKVPGQPANRYAIAAQGNVDGRAITATRQVFDLFGTDWGLGLFKLKACDYCDDIAGETADVALGDAWLPEEVRDWRGTNIVVIRNPVISRVFAAASRSREVNVRRASVSEFVVSQGANYRHRHDGLGYRLFRADQTGLWRPQKRIAACGDSLSTKRARLMDLRTALAEESHASFLAAKTDSRLPTFRSRMRRLVWSYQFANSSLTKHVVKQALIALRTMLRRG